MPFDERPRRIAVIGGGISGLGAAWGLRDDARVTLFEAAPRLGGHARTVIAGRRGDQPVDTGFIVWNEVNYPELVRLFAELDVPVARSDMGFGASLRGGRTEYALHGLGSLFAQASNAVNPGFLGMLRDILRFNAHAVRVAGDDRAMTIRDLLDRLGTGARFRDDYLLPMSGAIWSTPCAGILDFPAAALVRFFDNHNLLRTSGQHQWLTVRGGSVEYVRRLAARLVEAGVELRTGAPVRSVTRTGAGVEVRAAGGEAELFDEVVLATHADDTLALLSDADAEERAALSAVRYQPNRAVLHADPSVMPRRRRCWASWVYTDCEGPGDRIGLTYWMNSLQPIPKDDPLFVTLNGVRPIREELIHDEVEFRHPVYDRAALAAQDRIAGMQGRRGTWFCGAWMRNGFHEDGLASGLDVAMRFRAAGALPVAAE